MSWHKKLVNKNDEPPGLDSHGTAVPKRRRALRKMPSHFTLSLPPEEHRKPSFHELCRTCRSSPQLSATSVNILSGGVTQLG